MPAFKLDFKKVTLQLRQPFGISRGTRSEVTNVFVRLRGDGIEGFGEAAPNTRYNEDADKVIRYLEAIPDDFFDDVQTEAAFDAKPDRHNNQKSASIIKSGQSALEMAWLDWWGKKQGQPLWKLWGAASGEGPQTSYTIGLDEIGVMQQKVREAEAYPILKVKLGTERDKEIIRGIRQVTGKPIRVDANEGWTSVEEATDMIVFLADNGIELVEQPMPAGMADELRALKPKSPLPLAADESFMGHESLEEIGRAFDIINIKLMKIGSMVKAKRVMEQAKALDLQVMIGCMIESSLANTAGAVLSLWADYADLDGHVLIRDDPAKGLQLDADKRIILNEKPGLGVEVDFSGSDYF